MKGEAEEKEQDEGWRRTWTTKAFSEILIEVILSVKVQDLALWCDLEKIACLSRTNTNRDDIEAFDAGDIERGYPASGKEMQISARLISLSTRLLQV